MLCLCFIKTLNELQQQKITSRVNLPNLQDLWISIPILKWSSFLQRVSEADKALSLSVMQKETAIREKAAIIYFTLTVILYCIV